MVGEPYSETLTWTGGTSPVTWDIILDDLPAGLTLSASGLISGIPTTAVEGQTFTVEVTDDYRVSDSQVLSITIVPPLEIGPVIVSQGAGGDRDYEGTVDVFYSVTPEASGGMPPYVLWKITSGSLPPLPAGLTLNAGTGEISGTPTTPTTGEGLTFTLQVTDSLGFTGDMEITIKINARPMLTTTLLPNGYAKEPYPPDTYLVADGGTGALTFALPKGSKLLAGLFLDPDGRIWGTPTRATRGGQPVTFTVVVTDSLGAAESGEVTITVFK